MLELAVITHEETFERMKDPLKDRGIMARYIEAYGRQIPISKGDLSDFQNIDVGFVYPSRLMEGGVIDALLEVPWVNGAESVLLSRNKGRVLAILDKNGFDVPATIMISNPIGERELLDAYEKIQLGASLLQVYTAFVFRGPSIVKRINKGLCGLLRRDGFNHLSEAIGTKQDAIPAAV